jgi:hypothetical protein
MKRTANRPFDTIVLIVLLIAILITISLQIFLSGPESTRLETSLFSILQFIFSLGFSWLLARMSMREQFLQSQRNFALSAYRRIIEISNAVNRLISRTIANMERGEFDTLHELDVITEIGIGIRESIRSSISDWADLIGEEIETVEQIRTIREQQAVEQQSAQLAASPEKIEQEKEASQRIDYLLSTLPKSLKIATEDLDNEYLSSFERGRKKLQMELSEKGYIELRGFYDSAFERDIYDFIEGETLHVKIGDNHGGRVGALMAYDDYGRSVGVILNKFPGIAMNYMDAVDILIHCLKKNQFDVQITKVTRGRKPDERHPFVAKILDPCEGL